MMGIDPSDFSWKLSPGEEFYSPEAVLVYSDEGLGGMSRTFHKLYNNNLVRGPWKKAKRPLLINNWEGTYFDFDDDKLFNIAKWAKETGIEMLVMDDGWFGKRNDDTCALGDWEVNENKLRGGIGSLISRIKGLGLKFGIWYEPEMISPDSDLFRAHPDWHIHVPNRESSVGRHQYVIDMSRQDVRDYLFNKISEVLANNELVEKEIKAFVPRLLPFLQNSLHNRSIQISVRTRKQEEKQRAYNRVEQFNMMCQINEALLKLKEEFDLELG